MSTRQRILVVLAVTVPALAAPGIVEGQIPDARNPASPQQLADEALAKLDAGESEEAVTFFRRARLIDPTVDKLKLIEGLLLIHNNNHSEAIAKLQEYNNTETGKVDYRGFAAVGAIYKESRMYRQAVRPLERAKNLAPMKVGDKHVRAEITMDLAFVYWGRRKKTEAIEMATEAVAMAPNDPAMHLKLGQIAGQFGNQTEAVDAGERAIRLLQEDLRDNPFKLESHQNLRAGYQLLVDLHRAEIASHPDDPLPYYNMAIATRASVEAQRRATLLGAREYALQAASLNPKKLEWQVFLARIEAEMGATTDALDRLATVLEDAPDNQEALGLRAQLQASPAVSGAP